MLLIAVVSKAFEKDSSALRTVQFVRHTVDVYYSTTAKMESWWATTCTASRASYDNASFKDDCT